MIPQDKVKKQVIGDVEYLLAELRKLDESAFGDEMFLRSIDCAMRGVADVKTCPSIQRAQLRFINGSKDAA